MNNKVVEFCKLVGVEVDELFTIRYIHDEFDVKNINNFRYKIDENGYLLYLNGLNKWHRAEHELLSGILNGNMVIIKKKHPSINERVEQIKEKETAPLSGRIGFEEFEKHIKDIQRLIEFEDNLRGLVNSYSKDTKELLEISFPSLITNVVSLLSTIMNDNDEWIDYWAYELDCGKKYYDGCVKDVDKKNIPLKTIEDLWNILTDGI